MMLSTKFALVNCLKMVYQQPRPYWLAKGLLKEETYCARDYGNPSGFALIAMAFAISVELDIVKNVLVKLPMPKGKDESDTVFYTGVKIGLGLLATTIPWALSYSVAYGRFDVRANTWNQLLYGMLLGYWFGITGFYAIFGPLTKHVRALNKDERPSDICFFATLATLLTASLIGIQIFIFYIVRGRQKVDPMWEENIGKYLGDYDQETYFLNASLKRFGLTFVGYGLYLGLLLNARIFKGRQGIHSLSKETTTKSFLVYLARLILTLVMVVPFIVVLSLSHQLSKTAWSQFAIDAVLVTVMGIVPTLFLDKVCLLLGLYSIE